MTDVLEVLLELECLRNDLVHHPLKGVSDSQLLKLLGQLASIMAMILLATTSKECLAHQELISSGGMTSIDT